jgi:large subunit ribosomal protein L28
MPKVCYVCKKGSVAGRKKEGGVGRNVTGITKRTFKPNLQRVKIEENGQTKRVHVCTKCLKAGKVKKAI